MPGAAAPASLGWTMPIMLVDEARPLGDDEKARPLPPPPPP